MYVMTGLISAASKNSAAMAHQDFVLVLSSDNPVLELNKPHVQNKTEERTRIPRITPITI